MTPATLRALLDAATPGPWHSPGISLRPFTIYAESDADLARTWSEADATLIAELRNLAPQLLALWEAALHLNVALHNDGPLIDLIQGESGWAYDRPHEPTASAIDAVGAALTALEGEAMTNTPQTDQPSTAAGRALLAWGAPLSYTSQDFRAAILAIEAEAHADYHCAGCFNFTLEHNRHPDTARPVEPPRHEEREPDR